MFHRLKDVLASSFSKLVFQLQGTNLKESLSSKGHHGCLINLGKDMLWS